MASTRVLGVPSEHADTPTSSTSVASIAAGANGLPLGKLIEPPPPPEAGTASNSKALANSLLAFLGSGLLGLPHAMARAGMVGGVVVLWSIALIARHCMLLVVDCKTFLVEERGKQVRTYGDIGYYACGRWGSWFVNACVILTQTGFCVAYLIFISQNAMDVFVQFLPSLGVTREAIVAACMPVLILASWIRQIKHLAPLSVLAELSVATSLLAVLCYDAESLAQDPAPAIDNVSLFYLSGLPMFFGVAVYCFEGVGMVLPILNSMESPADFKRVWTTAMVVVTSLYSAFAVASVLAFGINTADIVTQNIPFTSPWALVVKTGLCVGLYFTYPLMIFPVFELFDGKFQRIASGRVPLAQTRSESPFRVYGLRSLYVLLTGAAAAKVPHFGAFISLVGASASALLAFILPSFFHLKLRYRYLTRWEVVRDLACISVGVLGGVVGTAHALKESFSGE